MCVKDSGPFPEGNEEVVREGSDMTVRAMFCFFFFTKITNTGYDSFLEAHCFYNSSITANLKSTEKYKDKYMSPEVLKPSDII